MPADENGSRKRRDVLRTIAVGSSGLVVGTGPAAARGGPDVYKGVAYDPATKELLGNASAKIKMHNGKLRGTIDISDREGGNTARLKGKIPKREQLSGPDWSQLPRKEWRNIKKKRQKKPKPDRRKLSVDLTNGQIPLHATALGERVMNDGTVQHVFNQQLHGRFKKNQSASINRIRMTEECINGNFIAPNRQQRVAFTVLSQEAGLSRATALEGLYR